MSIVIGIVLLPQKNPFRFFQKAMKDYSCFYIISIKVNMNPFLFFSATDPLIYDQLLFFGALLERIYFHGKLEYLVKVLTNNFRVIFWLKKEKRIGIVFTINR